MLRGSGGIGLPVRVDPTGANTAVAAPVDILFGDFMLTVQSDGDSYAAIRATVMAELSTVLGVYSCPVGAAGIYSHVDGSLIAVFNRDRDSQMVSSNGPD